MKRTTILLTFLLCIATLFAQAPQKFSYQAVVRNASNALITNAPIGVRISVLQGGVAGTVVYMETHTAVTNANGLVTLQIGSGSVQQGVFANIDWALGSYFLKTETDPSGGTNYSITSTQQLLSVPYALYANEAGNGFSGDYNDLTNTPFIPTVPTNVSAFTNDAGYLTSFTEQQVLSISHDTVFLTGGSFVKLPAGFDGDYNSLTNRPTLFSGNYNDLTNTPVIPTVPTNVSAFNNDAGYLTGYTETDPQFNAWDKDYNDLINKPVIPTVPTNVSAFSNDAEYITATQVPAQVNADWNATTGAAQILNKPTLFSGNYNDLTNKPTIPTVPTNVSSFTNDAGYLTGYTETDPQFNAWNKDYNDLTNRPVLFSGNYNDLTNKPTIPTVPTNVSAFANDAGYLTSFTEQQVLSISHDTLFLTGGSFVKLPAGFDGDYNSLTNKPVLFSGNYNDLTDKPTIPTVPTNVSSFNNDAGYLTNYTETDPQFNAWDKDYNDLTNKPVLFDGNYNSLSNKPNLATVATTGNYNDLTNKPTIPTVPTNVSAFNNDAGYITAANVQEAANIPTNVSAFTNDVGYITASQVPTQVNADWNATSGVAKILNKPTLFSGNYNDLTNKPALFSGSYNDLTNKPVLFDGNYNSLSNTPNLATVATTGNYNDLTNKPSLFSGNYNDLTNKPTLFSGNYNDLTNKPTIPTVPTNVSAFTNDAGYITSVDVQAAANIPTNVSAFNNDAGYITASQVPAQVNADWNATSGVAKILNKPTLFSGNYNDLTNKPTIPTVPTNVSAFTNDAGYITNSGIGCTNELNLCELQSKINQLESQLQTMSALINQSGTVANDSCPQHIMSIDGSPNVCFYGNAYGVNNIILTAWVDGVQADDATYTWYESGQLRAEHDGFGNVYRENWTPTYNDPYIFTVKVTMENGCSYLSAPFEVNVYAKPVVTILGSPTNVSPGGTVNLQANLEQYIYPTIQYEWFLNQVSQSHKLNGYTHNSEVFTVNETSDYIVRATYLMNYSVNNCNAYDTFHVEVLGSDTIQPSQHIISVSLTTDRYGSETTWEVKDVSANIILASGGPYNGLSDTGTTEQDIPDILVDGMGCYVFTINDSYGDGICCSYGNGSYSVSYDGEVIGYGGNSFSKETYILNPSSSTCPSDELSLVSVNISNYQMLNASFHVKGTVSNNGTNTINSFKVKYRVDGGSWSADNIVTCNIATLETFNFTHNVPISITTSGTHTIEVMVHDPNGIADNVSDNSISVEIVVNEIPGGDAQPCPGMPTVTDIDGNTYNTVKIGEQCWMKENLRTTKYSDGTSIALGTDTSSTTSYRYYPNNNSTYVSTYGYLYNWKAVMRNSPSSTGNPSGVQGICPTGWHVPSNAEWTQLTNYMSGHSAYFCGDSYGIAKALAANTGWISSTTTCSVGDDVSANNSSGFSALPAGYYNGYYSNYGYRSNFWSSTENNNARPYCRYLSNTNSGVTSSNAYRYSSYSVRCLRNEGSAVTFPTVSTGTVSNISSNSVSCSGNVTSDGGANVTARGVCWSTSQNPTINDSHIANGTGTGNFTCSITGLTSNTTYHVRAYATNSAGTAYGSDVSFTTVNAITDGQPCPNAATVTDYDGNTYNTVQIGEQCWMKQNLRTAHYSDGTIISVGNSTSTATEYRYYPNHEAANVLSYGYLYNWKAVMRNSATSNANQSGVQGVCPTGWHVPSNAEWTQLTNYLSGQSQYLCGGNNTYIAKALASTTGWPTDNTTCAVGNNLSTNNTTGFQALPAGFYSGSYVNFENSTIFWSCTESSSEHAYNIIIHYNLATVYPTGDALKKVACSVRCLKDDNNGSVSVSKPTVTTSEISNVTSTTARSGGDVTSDGGATVTSRGVCWSTSQNPTISGSHTNDGSGTGHFTSDLTGLTAGTTYYVRAYATNSAGTAYGSEVSFTTSSGNNSQDGQPCPNLATVSDYDGNTYNTVQIGNQCWMKENLRTTHYATGTAITQGSTSLYSNSDRYYYNPGNGQAYGYLYNWPAVIGPANVSANNQGVCPSGWHVPGKGEWTQLIQYVGSQSQYICDNNNDYVAKSLSSTTGWSSSSITCDVGNMPSSNNATGFSALPAGLFGYQDNGYFNCSGWLAGFWTATELSSGSASNVVIKSSDNMVSQDYVDWYNNIRTLKSFGYSVRCLRDEGNSTSLPTLTTNAVSWVTTSTATSGGYISSSGSSSVTARGVCWSTSHNPTLNDNHTEDGVGTGSFTSNIAGLSSGTTYYVRAYAVNGTGTNYGNEVSFTTETPTLPILTTNAVTSITTTAATSGGNITSSGGSSITARGICWSTSHNPTINNNHTDNGSGTGSFTSNMTGLNPGITYYVRAYAVNGVGTNYGNEVSFTTQTPFVCGTSTVFDYDNNEYNTVQIGSQCWMKENMRTTHYANGTSITQGSTSQASTSTRYYYKPSNSTVYGYLYNWPATIGPSSVSANNQGICPTGWHVPSDGEWTQLIQYVGTQSQYVCGDNSNYVAKALASTTGWSSSSYSCYVGCSPSTNNATGFCAYPTGYFALLPPHINGVFDEIGEVTSFWTCTASSSDEAYSRDFYYDNSIVDIDTYNKSIGYPVRCLRN